HTSHVNLKKLGNRVRRLEIEGEWPIWGKPGTIHVDNAAEFYSEALRRGCDQHGIRIVHRPVGQPHFGGTIERVLGTLIQHVHTLPGTTFSNPQDRETYASERHAAKARPARPRHLWSARATQAARPHLPVLPPYRRTARFSDCTSARLS